MMSLVSCGSKMLSQGKDKFQTIFCSFLPRMSNKPTFDNKPVKVRIVLAVIL